MTGERAAAVLPLATLTTAQLSMVHLAVTPPALAQGDIVGRRQRSRGHGVV